MTRQGFRGVVLLSAASALTLVVACHVQIGGPATGGSAPPAARNAQAQPQPPNAVAAPPPPSARGPVRFAQRTPPSNVVSPRPGSVIAPSMAPSPLSRPRLVVVAEIAQELGAPPSTIEVGKTRRSATKLVSPHKTTPPPAVSPAELPATRDAASFYATSETKIGAALRTDLQSMRTTIARERRSYQVGVTAVSGKPLAQINGGAEPVVDEAELARAAAERANKPNKQNLVSRDLQRRVGLPTRLAALDRARASDDQVVVRDASAGSSKLASPSAASFSWRDQMTPIREQGDCGSCWAFATMGVLEALHTIQYGQRGLDLSEQHLVNCAPNTFNTNNCVQNSSANVWKFLRDNGAAMESSVPYRGRVLACDRSRGTPGYTIEDWGYAGSRYTRPTVDEIKAAMVAHGPIVALVNSTRSFQHYTGGVFDDRDDRTTNHLIVLVGWDDRKGAWLLRNSWSSRWGEGGYMWIKYGSNAVGAYATWAEPVRPPAATPPTFSDRYLSLVNDSGEALTVSYAAEVPAASGFRWAPASPGPSAPAWTVRLAAGAKLDVKRPDDGRLLSARKARIWATSADGKRSWTTFKGKDWTLAEAPYKAGARERSTFFFGKQDAPLATADTLFADATAARGRSDWPRAERLYAEFAGRFPSDTRVHRARFLLGFSQYRQKQYDPAILSFADTVLSAPDGDPNIPFSLYYFGMSEAAQGDCGSAVGAFEAVAYGELDAPAAWVKAAQTNIERLEEDDGTICSNWD